jgi:hypothetical protein
MKGDGRVAEAVAVSAPRGEEDDGRTRREERTGRC